MLTIASMIASGEDKRLAAIGRPFSLVVERPSVPHRLHKKLGDANGMRPRAGTAAISVSISRVRDMAPVVWRVEILPVPASRKVDVGTNTPSARVFGEMTSVASSTRCAAESVVVEATKAESLHSSVVGVVLAGAGLAHDHAKPLIDVKESL
jgi:hypothetical protein